MAVINPIRRNFLLEENDFPLFLFKKKEEKNFWKKFCVVVFLSGGGGIKMSLEVVVPISLVSVVVNDCSVT